MAYQATRLDRFICSHTGIKRRDVRALLAQGRVRLNGIPARDISQPVKQFCTVTFDDKVLQSIEPIYIMLHKPAGVVSATRDAQHRTVLDLLPEPERGDLHIAGRLDFNSTGLMLLSNDGHWTKSLSLPENQLPKHYRVELGNPICAATVRAFTEGIYFSFENITTRPAQLQLLDSHVAQVTLCEGRYHQIKRMFGQFQNPVTTLHRYAVGPITLDEDLAPGQYRRLTAEEVSNCGVYP